MCIIVFFLSGPGPPESSPFPFVGRGSFLKETVLGGGGAPTHRPSRSYDMNPLTVPYHNTIKGFYAVFYTNLRAHETVLDLVCRLLLEKKKK